MTTSADRPASPVAAVDCGTNSIKVLIGRRRDDGTLDLDELARDYTMQEEHQVHGSGAAAAGKVADSEITFF